MYSMGTMNSRFSSPLKIPTPIRWDRHWRSAAERLWRIGRATGCARKAGEMRASRKMSPPRIEEKGPPHGERPSIDSEDERVPVDHEVIIGGLEPRDVHRGARHSGDRQVAVAVVHDRHVVIVVDVDRVARTVEPEVEVDVGEAASTRVVDVDRIRAGERIDRDILDVVQIHDDVALSAREDRMAVAGRQSELLGGTEAVEQHLIVSRAAFDLVAAVALVPDEDIIARAEVGDVRAGSADHEIVAGSADERVVAGAADERVVAALA